MFITYNMYLYGWIILIIADGQLFLATSDDVTWFFFFSIISIHDILQRALHKEKIGLCPKEFTIYNIFSWEALDKIILHERC